MFSPIDRTSSVLIKQLMNSHTDHIEIEKEKAHIIVEILEYIPSSILIKTIIKKTTGNVTVTAVDAGEEQQKKTMFELGNSHAIWKSVDLLFPEANGTCIH